jgi:hypothetical protein
VAGFERWWEWSARDPEGHGATAAEWLSVSVDDDHRIGVPVPPADLGVEEPGPVEPAAMDDLSLPAVDGPLEDVAHRGRLARRRPATGDASTVHVGLVRVRPHEPAAEAEVFGPLLDENGSGRLRVGSAF